MITVQTKTTETTTFHFDDDGVEYPAEKEVVVETLSAPDNATVTYSPRDVDDDEYDGCLEEGLIIPPMPLTIWAVLVVALGSMLGSAIPLMLGKLFS